MRTIIFILVSLIAQVSFAQLNVTSVPATPRLPKIIQNLSAEDYEAWAIWQNRQAELHSQKQARYNYEGRYITGTKIVVSATNGRDSSLNTGSVNTTNRYRTQTTATHSGYATRSDRGWNSAVATSVPYRYVNPDYTPIDPLHLYNPVVKGEGNAPPDWGHLYVPTPDGSISLLEALDQYGGPISPEKLYTKLLEGWF